MSEQDPPSRPGRLLRIFVSRERGLRALPGDYESLEDAQYIFEKHHGEIPWCVIAEIEPVTEQPRFLAYGTATPGATAGVEWKYVGIDDIGSAAPVDDPEP
jgi:hypothetical protein